MDNTNEIIIFKPDRYPAFEPDFKRFLSPSDKNYVIFPGFCDVHVHFREPGFSYKETIETGTKAAAHGGYTVVCTMPNLNPVPDSAEKLAIEQEIIDRDAVIDVIPYGSITVNEDGKELSDMDVLAPKVIAFSDDGKGIQEEDMMRKAMIKAKSLGKMIVAHCEDKSLIHGGYIHDGEYARLHGHIGISSESEWRQIERDVRLSKETGCAYHVCHVSTKESVEIIRQAKKEGINVTCETAPHYLVLTDMDLKEDGFFKVNPPLRSEADRQALIEALKDGTIDIIATDHAPHTIEEKSKGLKDSAFGYTGIETAFQVLYTDLVKTGIIPLEKLIELLVVNPRKRFGIPFTNDFTVWDLSYESTIDPQNFISKGKAMPLIGKQVFGKCILTVAGGKIAYESKD
jgi:dihydroorotase